ncbi:MAG TPA: DNA-binding response regulator [Pseudonocardiaceae bacterium]|nr:DNA-binding response regulator [Pseudonocardiaceae bacterium]
MSTTLTSGPIVTLRGEDEFLARAGHLFAPQEEFICAATNMSTWAVAHARRSAKELIRTRMGEGVRMQKMYNPGAVADPRDAEHLLQATDLGVAVRICPTALAHETIIIDRKVAIVAGAAVAGVRDYTVITAPEVVAGVRSLFLATWAGATDLQEFLPSAPPEVDEQGLAILRHLSAGLKDETAARSMGVSVRTYRRRVAELMTLLGAESRFQAGERARALGLRW